MRSILHLSLSLVALTAAYGFNDAAPIAPQTETVEPRIGKPGTIIKITGKSLDRAHVDEVYLTDHRFDMKVKVLDQNATQLTVRVPPFVKPGRLQLLILTAGKNPVYLEQPWFILIESTDEDYPAATPPAPTEISQKIKPTVEVASTGNSVPVPKGGKPPSPGKTKSAEKSVVPLKPEPVVTVAAAPVKETKPEPAPAPPVQAAPEPPAVKKADDPAKKQFEVATNSTNQDPFRQFPAVAPQPPPTQTQSQTPTPAPAPQAAQPPAAAPVIQSGGATVPAQILRRSRVSYPPAAMSQRVEGTVELTATVKADGHVKDVKVNKGNPLLVGAAISSVMEWLYEPATVQGRPVESEVSIILNFKRPQ